LSSTSAGASRPRAAVEGCCFALRDITDRFAALGLDTTEIRVVGGGARSQEWLQVKADVTGRPVRVVRGVEATSLGAALLAAVACETFTDLDEAVKTCVVTADEPILPRAANAAVYADAYGRYRALFDGIEGALA
jgi:xylulokinase